MNELDGFELFEPDAYKKMFITPQIKCVGICSEAYKALGCPEYVNVFIDDVKKRVLIKKADKEFANTIHVVCHSSGHNMNMCCRSLADRISGLHGRSKRVFGRVVGEGMMIFDRSDK